MTFANATSALSDQLEINVQIWKKCKYFQYFATVTVETVVSLLSCQGLNALEEK